MVGLGRTGGCGSTKHRRRRGRLPRRLPRRPPTQRAARTPSRIRRRRRVRQCPHPYRRHTRPQRLPGLSGAGGGKRDLMRT
ncbi:MAG: hypothetical protein AMS16_05170 [Planctomycetes bacterium DG_58]|nr:MAG: hypothetical protein AMS16_05170 [Planctomycetes bacterium DG_58]